MGYTHRESWNDYWSGAQRAGISPHAGAQDPALADFWTTWFRNCALADNGEARILDLGSGHGAVTGHAESVAHSEHRHFDITCLDNSQAAVDLVGVEHPEVTAICAGAENIPLPDRVFDHIVSQFGLEYAPLAAADEVARTLRPAGSIAFIMHLRDGAVFGECRDNRDALDAVSASGVFPAFTRLVEESLALRRGQGSHSAFERADRALSSCVKAMEATLLKYGRDVGGGLVFRTYADIGHMYQKLQAFDPQEVIAWAQRAETAISAWRDRMQSMLDAALDDRALQVWQDRLAAGGIALEKPTSLSMGEPPRDGAWLITGTKRQ